MNQRSAAYVQAVSILLSPGLLIIDHIHFQYNGFLFGILIISIVLAKENRLLASGCVFAILLCFKHIYLYIAPAYFIYLLRAYCLGYSLLDIKFANCIKLGVSIVGIFAIAFGPFVFLGQIPQLLSRLFPFSRGLCHAYWAPNVWAMYSFADRVLIYGMDFPFSFLKDMGKALHACYMYNSIDWLDWHGWSASASPRLGLKVDPSALTSVTRGLVGDTAFAVLPNITPRMTFLLTLFVQSVSDGLLLIL